MFHSSLTTNTMMSAAKTMIFCTVACSIIPSGVLRGGPCDEHHQRHAPHIGKAK
jgi:hypothetical protein